MYVRRYVYLPTNSKHFLTHEHCCILQNAFTTILLAMYVATFHGNDLHT